MVPCNGGLAHKPLACMFSYDKTFYFSDSFSHTKLKHPTLYPYNVILYEYDVPVSIGTPALANF